MMRWQDVQDHPYFIENNDAERKTVYILRSCQVEQLELDVATQIYKEVAMYYVTQPMPQAVAAWVDAFWTRLRAAPGEILTDDQWSTSYRSRMDGKIYHWETSRKENCDILWTVAPDRNGG